MSEKLVQFYIALTNAITESGRARSHRGATFVEYMLMAAIAVAVFIFLGGRIEGLFSDVISNISDAING